MGGSIPLTPTLSPGGEGEKEEGEKILQAGLQPEASMEETPWVSQATPGPEPAEADKETTIDPGKGWRNRDVPPIDTGGEYSEGRESLAHPSPSSGEGRGEGDTKSDRRELVKVPRVSLIGESLIEAGLISQEHLTLALDEQRITGERVGDILLRLGLVKPDQVNRLLAWKSGAGIWDIDRDPVNPALFDLLSRDLMIRHSLVPVRRDGQLLIVATPKISDVLVRFEVEREFRGKVRFLYAPEHQVSAILSCYLNRTGDVTPLIMPSSEGKDLSEGAVVDLVDSIFRRAITSDVTDIHFEPEEKVFRIRERIDGILHHRMTLSKNLHPPVVTRIKIMAGLDITENRLPQDGKIRFSLSRRAEGGMGLQLGSGQGPSVDIRVSTFLTNQGEKVVCRILQPAKMVLELSDLGLDGENLMRVQRAIEAPNGMILVSGPTGSGKTTTLYSLISRLYPLDKNIMTVEDPIEIELPLIRQSQVNLKAGLTFSTGLRAIMRQDPDVILVGEIRDGETAEIGLRAALTGHLLFSTIHTNDAVGVIARLRQLDIEPFMIASSLLLAMAQRLVRKICNICREEETPDDRYLSLFNEADLKGITFYKGRGCDGCNHTGYRGRIGIFEVLPVTRTIRKMIEDGAPQDEIVETARDMGFSTLREDALSKVRRGITSLEEVVRVTMDRE